MLSDSHVKEGDIVSRYRRLLEDNSLKELENIPDENHKDIVYWIKDQMKVLVRDRMNWARRGGTYKGSQEDWEGHTPGDGHYPEVKGY